MTRNFDVVYSYNAAESYSLAACVLADRLAGGPGIVTPWPTDDPGLSRAERRELQTLLTRKGYDVGEPDGAIGAKTKAAIADFRAEAGHAGERAGLGQGAGGAEKVRQTRPAKSGRQGSPRSPARQALKLPTHSQPAASQGGSGAQSSGFPSPGDARTSSASSTT